MIVTAAMVREALRIAVTGAVTEWSEGRRVAARAAVRSTRVRLAARIAPDPPPNPDMRPQLSLVVSRR